MRTFALFVLLVLGGCGGIDSVIPPGGSCQAPGASLCVDYSGTGWRTPSVASSSCSQFGQQSMTTATYSSASCAAANRVGSCRLQPGATTETTQRFYGPRYNATTAQAACQALGGTFTAG